TRTRSRSSGSTSHRASHPLRRRWPDPRGASRRRGGPPPTPAQTRAATKARWMQASYVREIFLMKEVIQPHVRELLLHRILSKPSAEVREIHAVHVLILVEAREDDRLLAGLRIDVLLKALRADFLHHALHRRV